MPVPAGSEMRHRILHSLVSLVAGRAAPAGRRQPARIRHSIAPAAGGPAPPPSGALPAAAGPPLQPTWTPPPPPCPPTPASTSSPPGRAKRSARTRSRSRRRPPTRASAATSASRRDGAHAFAAHRTLIVMDAPPPMEDCAPFVHIARLLDGAGVHAPQVLAADLGRGFLLLTDLGQRTYLAALDATSANGLYTDAIDALVRWQCATREGELPAYDEALLARELALFPDWYVGRHLARTLTAAQGAALQAVFRLLLDNNLAQPRVFVHRDYHSRNLMVCERNPGVLDFQDAVIGPDDLRPRLAAARRLRELGRGARDRLGDPLLGARAPGRPAGGRGLRQLLARLRVDGRAASAQGARDLRAPRPPRRQARAISTTCRG